MPTRQHALIIGASISGLLAARVLSRRFQKVTILERDAALPAAPEDRRFIPQGSHIHVLLARGGQVLERLFPGFTDALIAQGVRRVDPSLDVAWYHFGAWKVRTRTDISCSMQSRALLEWLLRQRVLALPEVELVSGRAADLKIEDGRVRGVVLADGQALEADLVIDASGRSSKLSRGAAIARPEEEGLGVEVGYVSRRFRLPELDYKSLIIYPEAPMGRGAAAMLLEDDRWIVTLIGWCGERARADDAGFLAYADTLAHPRMAEVLREGEPCSEITRFRYASSCWRRFDKLSRPTPGLLVVGDALCSFDPVFGQGMTTAALVSEALEKALEDPNDRGLERRFFKSAARVIAVPWMLSRNEDLRFPEVRARRPFGIGVVNRFTARLHRAAARDPEVVRAFLKVMHMVEAPTSLLRPRVLSGVLRHGGAASPSTLPPPPRG